MAELEWLADIEKKRDHGEETVRDSRIKQGILRDLDSQANNPRFFRLANSSTSRRKPREGMRTQNGCFSLASLC